MAYDLTGRALYPLSTLLAQEEFPLADYLPQESLNSVFGALYYTEAEAYSTEPGYHLNLRLAFEGELALVLPGLPVVSLVAGAAGSSWTSLATEFLIGPEPFAVLREVPLVLRLDRSILKPMRSRSEVDESKPGVDISFAAASFEVNTEGFQADLDIAASLPLCMIADSGVLLEAANVRPILGPQDSLPAGLDEYFRGVFIQSARIYLPEGLPELAPADLTITNCTIGAGGFSGSLALSYNPAFDQDTLTFSGPGSGTVFGMQFGLSSVAISIKQNSLEEGSIVGSLVLPYFDAPLNVTIGLLLNGGFTVSLDASSGLVTVDKPGVLTLTLESLRFALDEGVFTVVLSGQITPLIGAPGLDWPSFRVQELSIDSEGHVRLKDGWLDLPDQYTLSLYGFSLEIARIGFGTTDDGDRWIGFSGGLSLGGDIPMSGSVEGFRIKWRDGSPPSLQFDGASISLEVPGSLEFSGRVNLINDGGQHGFRGSGTLKELSTGISVDAEALIIKNGESPAYVAFYAFVDVQFPVGIPIVDTSTAIYGVAGLFGGQMVPNRQPNQEWYEDWYLTPEPGVKDAGKWGPRRGALSFGAGVTIGTAYDDGYAAHGHMLMAITFPGQIMLLLEGRGTMLQKRGTMGNDPPFTLFAVMDHPSGLFRWNMAAKWPKDEEQRRLSYAEGAAEAFFDLNNKNNWYLYLGQRDPIEKRIRAVTLGFLESNFYLMLLPSRLEFGMMRGYNGRWKYGPLKVELAAYIDGQGLVSWQPTQFRGQLALVGQCALKAFGRGARLALYAAIEAEAPSPYRVHADIDVRLDLPKPLKDLKATITIEHSGNHPAPPPPDPLSQVGVEHLKVGERWILGSDPAGDVLVVPLDGKVAISFTRPVEDACHISRNPSAPPPAEPSGDYLLSNRLVSVSLWKRVKAPGSTWARVAERSTANAEPDQDRDRLFGVWLAAEGPAAGVDTATNTPMTKLLLHAHSPFEYGRNLTDDAYFDNFTARNPDFGWVRVRPPEETCMGFGDLDAGDKQPNLTEVVVGDVIFLGDALSVQATSDGGAATQALRVGTLGKRARKRARAAKVAIVFPVEVHCVSIQMSTAQASAGGERILLSLCDGITAAEQTDIRVINTARRTAEVKLRDGSSAQCTTLVLEARDDRATFDIVTVCYTSVQEQKRFMEAQALAAHAADGLDDLTTQLFSPHHDYRVQVRIEVRRLSSSGAEELFPFDDNFYFQTMGPPGLFDVAMQGSSEVSEGAKYPQKGQLRDLREYVDEGQTIPTHESLAIYRTYDVTASFNEAYVDQLYLLNETPLTLALYDTNGRRVPALDGDPASVSAAWTPDSRPQETLHAPAMQQWQQHLARSAQALTLSAAKLPPERQRLLTHAQVASLDLPGLPVPTRLSLSGEDLVLQPRTLYRAVLEPIVPRGVIEVPDSGQLLVDSAGTVPMNTVLPGTLTTLLRDTDPGNPVTKLITDGRHFLLHKKSGQAQPAQLLLGTAQLQAIRQSLPAQPLPPSRAVFSWNFTTSRFTTFVHHVQSFLGAAWDQRSLMPQGPAQVDLTDLQNCLDAGDPKATYEQALKCCGLGEGELGDRLEIRALEFGGRTWGFYIESPEPLPGFHVEDDDPESGKRVSIRVLRSGTSLPYAAPTYEPIRMISCSLEFGRQWIDIVQDVDADLAGYSIVKIIGNAGNETKQEIFRFPAGSYGREGCVTRVHLDAQDDAERTHSSVPNSQGSLDWTQETLALSDPSGRERSRRTFLADSEYQVVGGLVTVSDEDATRIFVLHPTASLGDGSYRIDWTFRREVPDLVTLKRRGSSQPEETTTTFVLPALLPGAQRL